SKLLQKTASARPKSVAAVVEVLDAFGKPGAKEAKKTVSEQELNDKVDAVLGNPSDEVTALLLESLVDRGAEAGKVAEAFMLAADQVETGEDDEAKARADHTKKELLFRAARIYEGAKELDHAEATYAQIAALDANDESAFAGLEEVRRTLGKHEEL